MRKAVLESFIGMVQKAGPIGEIVKACVRGKGVTAYVDADKVLAGWNQAGYEVEIEQGNSLDSNWVRVYRAPTADEIERDGEQAEKVMVAQGFSRIGKQDAVLQAAYGAVREENAQAVITEEANGTAVQLTPEIRLTLERVYIKDGIGALREALGK